MSLLNTIRNAISATIGSPRLFSSPPLVQQLLPADEQPDSPPAAGLAVLVDEWQVATADFSQRQASLLRSGLQRTYEQVRDPVARRRARRAQLWLRPTPPGSVRAA